MKRISLLLCLGLIIGYFLVPSLFNNTKPKVTIIKGKWHHVAFGQNKNEPYLFWDGVRQNKDGDWTIEFWINDSTYQAEDFLTSKNIKYTSNFTPSTRM